MILNITLADEDAGEGPEAEQDLGREAHAVTSSRVGFAMSQSLPAPVRISDPRAPKDATTGSRLPGSQSDAVFQSLFDTFWKLVDEILDAVLFVLIGLEVLLLTGSASGIDITSILGRRARDQLECPAILFQILTP